MGCARFGLPAPSAEAVPLEETTPEKIVAPPRTTPCVPAEPPSMLHIPGTTDCILQHEDPLLKKTANPCLQPPSQPTVIQTPPGFQPLPVNASKCLDVSTQSGAGFSCSGENQESLYSLACQSLSKEGFPRSNGINDSDQLEASFASVSCVRGLCGVTCLSFSENPLLLQSQRFMKTMKAASPRAVCGKQMSWVRGEVLGRGTLGVVSCALDQHTGQLIAVKEIAINITDEADRKFRTCLEHEINIIRDLKHPHIVSYLGHDYIDSSLCIYLEYMPGGSLALVLKQYGVLDESLIAVYTRELLEGLEYLHSRAPPVLHRDIKSSNVLVGMDCRVKLADFGCSRRTDDTLARTMKGSIPWMAPEVILKTGYECPADIWSLGCVVIEMASAQHPWGRFDNPVAACYQIAMSENTPPVPDTMSPNCQKFLECCFRREPIVRLSATQLISHPFVNDLGDGAPERRGNEQYLNTVPADQDLLDLVGPECVD